jgi:hypothetical protein
LPDALVLAGVDVEAVGMAFRLQVLRKPAGVVGPEAVKNLSV